MKCPTCRRGIPSGYEHCPFCGARLTGVQPAGPGALIEATPKSPALAAAMSFFLPGLGQLYLGQTGKGILFLILLVPGLFTAGLSHLALLLYATAEAWVLARRVRGGEPISKWGTLWDPTWSPFGR